jgi:hypothetical protein
MSVHIQLVFESGVSAQDALRRTDNAVFALEAADLAPFGKAQRLQPADTLELHRWRQQGDPPTAIDLTIDRSIPAAFVSVASEDASHARVVAEALNEFLRVPSASDHVRQALEHPEDATALLRAAMAATQERDERLEKLVESRLASSDANERKAAIKAAALLAWPSLAKPLQAAAARETDAELQRFLAIALKKTRG